MIADPTGPDRYPTRILCPTDFTGSSLRALEYAIALARPVKGAITLLHVRRRRPDADPEDDSEAMPRESGPRPEVLERPVPRRRRRGPPGALARRGTRLALATTDGVVREAGCGVPIVRPSAPGPTFEPDRGAGRRGRLIGRGRRFLSDSRRSP
jgi:hypothetical protein